MDGLEHATRQPEQVGDGLGRAAGAQLLDRDVDRVVVGDVGARLHHLGQRPVRDALAVGQRPPGEHGRALERRQELLAEARLPHTGLAVDGEQVRTTVADRPCVRVLEQLLLRLAAHEGRFDGGPRAAAVDADRRPGPDRALEAAKLDRPLVVRLDPAERQPMGAGAEQDLACSRLLLEPGGHVDCLSGGEGRVSIAGDDLAGLDAHPGFQLELADGVDDRERGANGPLGVVLVGLRNAESGHDRIARELLDFAPVCLDAL